MATGFFNLQTHLSLPQGVREATSAVFRLNPGRRLHHRLFENEEQAKNWDGFVVSETGVETLQCGWTPEQIDALNLEVPGPDWARGTLHELVVHLSKGGSLPYETALTGSATATLVSPEGYLLTVQHLVTGVQKHLNMPEKTLFPEGLLAPHLGILTPNGVPLGPIHLCYVDSKLDVAVLKASPPEGIEPIRISKERPRLHDRVWHWCYPHRTFRSESERNFLGYDNADHDLRYSPGLVVAGSSGSEWFTDADATLGSSGSAVLNDAGELVGIYRGGGARDEYPDDPYRYRRCVDVCELKKKLPEVF